MHFRKALALEGDYREEHLFVLQHAFSLYGIYEEKINACDEQMVRETATLPEKVETKAPATTTPQRGPARQQGQNTGSGYARGAVSEVRSRPNRD